MSSFDARLSEYAGMVERELTRRLECKAEQPPYGRVLEAMRYSLLSGGKRVRGVMTLAFYRLFDEDFQKALPFAAAIEMIHAYSLIHDDLPCMDDDDMRRGVPSCHIVFGEAVALLAGDGLLTLAFETAASCDTIPADRVLRAIRFLASAAGAHGMVGGQVMDLENEEKSLTANQLDDINALKTGALLRCCAEIGCVLGGADEAGLVGAREYAANVGLAYQIIDDVLDVTADPEKLGKPVGSDARGHKNTYAAILGVEQCRETVAGLNRRAKAALEALGPETRFLAELADMLGGREF